MKKITNKEFTSNRTFIKACENVGLEPTLRQASKYRNKKGLAFKFKRYPAKYLLRQVKINKEK